MTSNIAAPMDFQPLLCAKALLRGQRFGSLATITNDGAPYASLVNIATTIEGIPIILISRLALHTRNIISDSRVSLLLSQIADASPQEDPAAKPRMSISAQAVLSTNPNDHRRFLARHPGARGYANFSDFAFYRLIPIRYHLVAGFGRIHELTPGQMLPDLKTTSDFATIEEDTIAYINKEHKNILTFYASQLTRKHSGDWHATGIDPEGIDLISISNNELTRIWFDKSLTGASDQKADIAFWTNLIKRQIIRAKS